MAYVSWSVTYVDFGGMTNLLPQTQRTATIASVPADASQAPAGTQITFATAFPTACTGVNVTIQNYSGSDNAALNYQIVGTPTTSGFSIIVGGGQPGSTVSIFYEAIGD